MKVDPPVIRIPRKLAEDPELEPFFRELARWKHDMWIRSGGGNDAIENLEIENVTTLSNRATESESDDTLIWLGL